MENSIDDRTIKESIKSKANAGAGFEMSPEQAGSISAELTKLHDAINQDRPIEIEDIEKLGKLARETKIDVGGEVMTVEEAEKIPDLKMNMEIWKEMSGGDLNNTGSLTRITPKVSKYLEKENYIDLRKLTSAKGLILPSSIEGDLDLRSLTSTEGLVLPVSIIGGFLNLNSLMSAHGLVLPSTLSCDVYLSGLTSAKGLVFTSSVVGSLYLKGLTSAEGLVLPASIGGDLALDGLVLAEGLVLPKSITMNIYLNGLSTAEKDKLREKYPKFSGKII